MENVNYNFFKLATIIFLKFYAHEIVLTITAIESQANFGSSIIKRLCVLSISYEEGERLHQKQ